MDTHFEQVRGELALLYIFFNAISKGNHVSDIDRINRTIKERVCNTYNDLYRNLKCFAGVLIREMVYAEVLWFNIFPAADVIYDTISPQAMLTGMKIRFSHNCLLEFGGYVHTVCMIIFRSR